MRVSARLLYLVSHGCVVNANVEKSIFLGPNPVSLANVPLALDALHVSAINPDSPILATQLPVQFPDHSAPHGVESWYLLHGLSEGARYEVRICWPATQPTDFWLDTYTVTQVFDTPPLISSLSLYSKQRQELGPDVTGYPKISVAQEAESVLFLRIQAAASYYSLNRTLMEYPPPVDVDIILDPFLLNIFPRSLGPVAIYITAVAIGAWFLSGYIYRWLLAVATEPLSKKHTD